MPLKTITPHGTAQRITTSTTPGAARVTLQYLGVVGGSTVYVGIGGNQINTGSAVSSAAYDAYLNVSNPSLTIGMGETMGDSVDASNIWIDTSADGEGVAWFVEQV